MCTVCKGTIFFKIKFHKYLVRTSSQLVHWRFAKLIVLNSETSQSDLYRFDHDSVLIAYSHPSLNSFPSQSFRCFIGQHSVLFINWKVTPRLLENKSVGSSFSQSCRHSMNFNQIYPFFFPQGNTEEGLPPSLDFPAFGLLGQNVRRNWTIFTLPATFAILPADTKLRN